MKKKRAIINIITSVSYQVLSLAVGLLIPKMYTETFGSVYNGLNQTITQIMRLMAVLYAGISAASIQAMFKPIARKNENTISAIFNYTARQYRKMGCYFVIILFFIGLVWSHINKESISSYYIIAFLLIHGVSASMEYFFQGKYTILLTAHNKSFVVYIINNILLVVGTIVKILVLLNFRNIILYQSILLLIVLLRLIIINAYVKRKFKFIDKKAKDENFEIKQRKDVLVSEVAGFVINSTDLIVLTMNCGLIYASIYSVYYFVVRGLSNVLGSVREGVFAGIGQTYFENKDKFRKVFNKFETLYFVLMFYLFTLAILLYLPFIRIYTEKMDINYVFKYFPIMFVTMTMLVNLRIPSIILINTAGHFKQVKKYAVIEAVINFFISFCLSLLIGINGVLIGTILGGLYRTPILVHYSNKNIAERSNIIYLRKIGILCIPFAIAVFLSFLLEFSIKSFAQWLLLAVILAIIVMPIYISILYFIEKEMSRSILNKLNRILSKNQAL